MEVERARWSTQLQYQTGGFHQAMHVRNVTEEQSDNGCTLVIEEEAELRDHLQSGESGLLSMDDFHGGFNSKLLTRLGGFQGASCSLETGIAEFDQHGRQIVDQLKKNQIPQPRWR